MSGIKALISDSGWEFDGVGMKMKLFKIDGDCGGVMVEYAFVPRVWFADADERVVVVGMKRGW